MCRSTHAQCRMGNPHSMAALRLPVPLRCGDNPAMLWNLRLSTRAACALAALLLGSCTHLPGSVQPPDTANAAIMDVHLLAFNDLHGHLQPPGTHQQVPTTAGGTQRIPTGGLAWLAGTVQQLRQQYAHSAVVSAGDMVGASALLSSLFLDEPTVEAANALPVDFAAVGNHEFDQGWPELLRLAHGGCERHTNRQPCQLSPAFAGARFTWLAANVRTAQGTPLLPASGLHTFRQADQQVTVGFIGMTLQATPKLVAASAVQGLQFADEADTANALVPQLLAQGADVIVVLLHEGGSTQAPAFSTGCQGLSGAIVPILERLDPRISVVVSGHTHQSYVCDYATRNPQRPMLLTSAGAHGTQLTDIHLRWDTQRQQLVHRSARTLAVPADAQAAAVASPVVVPGVAPHAQVQQIIERYHSHAQALAQQVTGYVFTPQQQALTRQPRPSGEVPLGQLIADAQLWAMRSAALGGADIAFMHSGGIRADLQPAADGSVRFEQLYAVQPFGNNLIGMTLTGAQIKTLLEDTYTHPRSASNRPRVLTPNAEFSWQHDPHAPAGAQVHALRLRGQPLDMQRPYRVIVSSFLADGAERYAVLAQGTQRVRGPVDIDALADYVRAHSPLHWAWQPRIHPYPLPAR